MTEETNHAKQNAQGWAESIQCYIVAMDEESWTRRDELKGDEAILDADDTAELAELTAQLSEYDDADDARTQAEESALSIELTGTWAPGTEPKADGFIILLTTGGPALRIVGELNEHNEPYRAWMEYQDWGTPWTRYHQADEDDLLTFTSIFYFGG